MRNFSEKIVEKIETDFMFNNVFRKSFCLLDNLGKYYTAGQKTDGNMAHVL